MGNDLRDKGRRQIRRRVTCNGRGGSIPLLANKLGNRRRKLFEQFPGERNEAFMLAVIENKIATSIGGFRERRDEWG